jgi:hypothetical protein
LWYILFFLVALKIPLVYLCYVVWWAVKDPPQPGEADGGVLDTAGGGGDQDGSWWQRQTPKRPQRRGPHGSPARRPEPALTRARTRPPA